MTEKELVLVTEKIARIRALAERGGTPAEAEAAAMKMSELMLRHNISSADLDRHAEKTHRKVVHESWETIAHRYRIDLLFTVAEAHLCKAIRITGEAQDARGYTKKNYIDMEVVGHEHNLVVVRETWHWLIKEIDRLAAKALKDAKAAGDYWAAEKPSTWTRDYRAGCVTGIRIAYRAMREAVKADTKANQWALVPVLEAEVNTYYTKLYPDAGTMKSQKGHMRDAYDAGKADGSKINLGRQVAGAASAALTGGI